MALAGTFLKLSIAPTMHARRVRGPVNGEGWGDWTPSQGLIMCMLP